MEKYEGLQDLKKEMREQRGEGEMRRCHFNNNMNRTTAWCRHLAISDALINRVSRLTRSSPWSKPVEPKNARVEAIFDGYYYMSVRVHLMASSRSHSCFNTPIAFRPKRT